MLIVAVARGSTVVSGLVVVMVVAVARGSTVVSGSVVSGCKKP